MAQLKDLLVQGPSRFIGDVYANTVQLTSLSAPTSAGGTTYGAGTSGQVLKTNGTSVYWAADSNSDTNVTQTITTTSADYRLLFSSTADDTTRTEGARKDTDLRWNPSTNTMNIAASNANGSIKTSSGTFALDSASTLYLNSGSSASVIFTRGGADTSHEAARFNTSGNLIIGATSGQNDITGYKLYVSGADEFNIGTTDTTSAKKFIIYGNNRFLSFGGAGIQAYSGAISSTTTGTLFLNYMGGSFQAGTSDNPITSGNFYGTFDFKSANGFTYSGIGTASDNAARPVWFSYNGVTGRPVYDNDFKYNPSTNVLTVGSITGSAASATKATQDSDGNAINTTYIKKSIGTTAGDIIYWSVASTPARLGIGTNGQVLKVVNGVPAWSTDSNSLNWGQITQSGANNIDEGTSDFTDNTEIFSSYASNNGFADSNATGKVYRRDAIHMYNYVKTKLNVTNNTINLSRNTETTIATIGGVAIKIKLPASDNTNTATAADDILDGSNSGTEIKYAPYGSQQSKLSFDTSTTNPTRTDRLNLNGYLYATKYNVAGSAQIVYNSSNTCLEIIV